MIKAFGLTILILAGIGCIGCSSDASVSREEEARFKNPKVGDVSKLPPDAFKPKGPAYVGEPTKASSAHGSAPPKSVTGN